MPRWNKETVFAKRAPQTFHEALEILSQRGPIARMAGVTAASPLQILVDHLVEYNITTIEAALLVRLVNEELQRIPYTDPNRDRLNNLKVELSSRYQQRKRSVEHVPTGEEENIPPRPLRYSRNSQ